MAKQTIFRGTLANDGTGDNLRLGANKINDNFTELYTLLGDGSTLASGTVVTTAASQTLTNKTISGANNTISNIPVSALSSTSITIGDDTSTNFNVSLGESFEIIGGSGINTAITNNRIVLSTDGSIVTETSTDTLTNKTIAAGSNTITGLTNTNLSGTAGITNANLANSSIRIGDDSSSNFDVGLGESFEITGGTGVTTAITNNRIELSVGSIPNSSLSNSSLTLGATAVSLGATAASASNFSLTGSSSVSGTGTIDLTGAGSKARFDFAGFGSLPAFGTYQGMFAFDSVGNRPYYSSGSGWVRILDENASVSAHTDVNLTGIADGYILQWSSGDGRFNVVANSGGATSLRFSDESSTLGTIALATETLGFIGTNGISTSINPGNKTITISGAGISSGIASVAADSTPQLGGDLDTQGNDVQDIGYVSHRSPDATITQTLVVTQATKTTEHTSYGEGSSLGYLIDGHEGAHLQLSRGVYKFDLSSGTLGSHPFKLYEDEGKNIQYTTGVTTSGTGGSAGNHLTITIDDDTVTPLYYQCSSHSNMGGRIDILGGKRRRLNITTDKSNTGDGSDTTFTILANRTVDDILVFVNGVCLVPTDDYTISGTTLTFQTAPANTAEIVIRYLG